MKRTIAFLAGFILMSGAEVLRSEVFPKDQAVWNHTMFITVFTLVLMGVIMSAMGALGLPKRKVAPVEHQIPPNDTSGVFRKHFKSSQP